MATAIYPQTAPDSTAPARDFTLVGAVIGLVLLIAGCYFVGAIGAMRIVYPLASFAVALWLYTKSRPDYVSFTCWIWFLSALVRRFADFKGGYQEPSIILLAPYLVTFVSGIDLLTRARDLLKPRSIPFVCAFVAILYGTVVGLTKYSPQQMAQMILNWLVPLCFAFFLVESYEEYEAIRRSLQRTFLGATLLMGAYGIYQFFFLPPWDVLWLSNVKTTTFGIPEPMQLRGFSTMNAPVIFALTIMGTLLVSLVVKSRLRLVVVICGFLGLLFSFNRSAWIGLVAGTIFILIKEKMRERLRIIAAIAVAFLITWSVVLIPGVREPVTDKLQTMMDARNDISLQARLEGYESALTELSNEPFGEGVASPDIDHPTMENDDKIGPHDSMILELLYSLGWCGTFAYLIGFAIVIGRTVIHKATDRPFENSMKALIVALFAQCLLNDIVYGEVGWMLWAAGAVQLAAIAHAEWKQEVSAASPVLTPELARPSLFVVEESGS